MLRKILLPLVLLQFATALYAEDEIWIDFSALPPGYVPEAGAYARQYDPAPIQEDDETVVDYSNVYDPFSRLPQNLLPSRFENQTASNGNPAYDEMRLSLALDRWQVKLSGSSNLVQNKISSQVVAYNTRDSSSRYPGEQIMAVHFSLPDLLVNSKAWIVPEFSIPPYSVAPGTDLAEDAQKSAMERMGQFLNKGVLRNVGPVRSITATVYGRRFPVTLFIEADHTDIGKREYPMGSLRFSGWQDLVWTNPNYVADVRKRSYENIPEYPRGVPSMILRALRIDRSINDVSDEASQVVFYVKEIRVVYDDAISDTFDTEIDDEQIWQLNTFSSGKAALDNALNSSMNTVDRYLELENRAEYPSQDTTGEPAATSGQ